ncbi:hypothetical protein GP486_004011 [Trichoglossum hirsutum]|uniref:Uncharacterized protein n=1 Tax=Trichoglossum hirsutum TaxID=265104 RepID=A0A9P8LC18_9PEZI|nr:hypothetical protein GP486_004011 [Trichoglossum hirsutum]
MGEELRLTSAIFRKPPFTQRSRKDQSGVKSSSSDVCILPLPRCAKGAMLFLSNLVNTPIEPTYCEYVFPNPRSPGAPLILTLLPSKPPNPDLAIGTTTKLPPTPDSFTGNPKFLSILQEVLSRHAHEDQQVISQAQAMVSQAGSGLGSSGASYSRPSRRQHGTVAGGLGAGGSVGAGGGGVGGWVHVSDTRNPPDFGRIAWPEDIFGSIEVDGKGNFVDGHGRYQSSGTYRIVTREGILGLSPFLREKLVERLRSEEPPAQ